MIPGTPAGGAISRGMRVQIHSHPYLLAADPHLIDLLDSADQQRDYTRYALHQLEDATIMIRVGMCQHDRMALALWQHIDHTAATSGVDLIIDNEVEIIPAAITPPPYHQSSGSTPEPELLLLQPQFNPHLPLPTTAGQSWSAPPEVDYVDIPAPLPVCPPRPEDHYWSFENDPNASDDEEEDECIFGHTGAATYYCGPYCRADSEFTLKEREAMYDTVTTEMAIESTRLDCLYNTTPEGDPMLGPAPAEWNEEETMWDTPDD